MSSTVINMLMEENMCSVPDLIKSMSEDLEESNLEVEQSVDYKGDTIGQLLDQMVQILPPEERNIFGCSEDKNIEEIILEANELLRSSTPMFSSSDSTEISKKWKVNIKTKSPINSTSSDLKHSSEHSQEHSGTNTICSSLESIILKSSDDRNIQTDESGYVPTQNYKGVCHSEDVQTVQFIGESIIKEPDSLQINKYSVPADISIHHADILNENGCNDAHVEITNKMENYSDNTLNYAINPQGLLQNTMTGSVSQSDSYEEGGYPKKSQKTTLCSQSELESKVKLMQQKYESELEDLKMTHTKEVQELTGHIQNLNYKIDKFKKQNKNEKTSDANNQHLERLESEINSQEQLLIGYEKENKKLCKEISALKDVWKQRENKLLEEKQRLQNELLGMVSKTTTENLEEQLKDAQETIVKLRMELTTYKSCNKELEASCGRLRSESQRLQTELANCNCERSPSRHDRYSFLASSNVGHQIQQLKNVIARKDAEIAQMNSTLEILRGEMGNSSSVGGGFKELSIGQQLETHSLTISQLQTALAVERQHGRDLSKEKELLLKENFDLKRQVRELESIVKRRQKSDSCFPVTGVNEAQSNSRLLELEKELSTRQESLNALHSQFLNMQKKYEDHIEELEARLKECREELQNVKLNQKKEEASNRINTRKIKQANPVVKEETHLLATIRGLRQEAASREKEISKLNKEIEEVRLTNKRLQKEREKQLNSMTVTKMAAIREKANLRKADKGSAVETRTNLSSPNNKNQVMFAELQESNLILKSKTKSLQEEVKRLEQDLITMHNKRVHDLNTLQSEHELEVSRLMDERAAFLSQTSTTELQGQLYTQQMVINHLKNRLKQMEELKNEVTLLRAERDHLEESLAGVNKKMCYLQNAQSPESPQYKTLLAKLETLEKNQEIREQKLNSVRELLSRSTQAGPGAGPCGGSCRDKLLDKNRQICYYRAQMDRILEALLDIRRTK